MDDGLISSSSHLGGPHRIYKFNNGYGASTIKNKLSHGGDDSLWELAVIRFNSDDNNDWDIVYDTPITRSVIGWLSDDDLHDVLNDIRKLKVYDV